MDRMTAALIVLVLTSFTIHAATHEPVADLSPSGGEVFIIGSDQLIRTDSKPRYHQVRVKLSRDGGATFPETLGVIDNTNSDKSLRFNLSWTVTGPASDQCVLQFTGIKSGVALVTSEGSPFSIGLPELSGVAPDHGTLGGLGDDDHPQYLLADGTRALSGDLGAGGNKITGLGAPTANGDSATKQYVDDLISALDHGSLSGLDDDDHLQYLRTDGSRALTGDQSVGGNKLTNLGAPTANADAATKKYVDDQVGAVDHGNLAGLGDDDHTQYLRTDGTRALTGDQSAGNHKIMNLATPTASSDAATKGYADTATAAKVSKAGDSMSGNLDMQGNQMQNAGLVTSSSGGFKFPDNTVQTTATVGGGVPAGYSILGDTSAAPAGYTYTGDSLNLGGNSWTTRTNMPTARASTSCCVLNGKIHVIGGQTGTPNIMTGVQEIYDPSTNTWDTSKASMPTARRDSVVALANGKIYAIGGFDGSYHATNEEYDPGSDSWTSKADMPTARAGAAVAVLNNKIHVIGGNDGGGVHEVYDPSLDTWDTLAPMTARGGATAEVINGKIFVFGGAAYTDLVEAYDPDLDSWSTKASMPTARGSLSGGLINGKFYAIGGLNSGSSWLDTNEEYDPATNSWSARAAMPTARYGLAVGVVGNRLFAIGGYQSGFLNKNEEYSRPLIYYIHKRY